MSTSLLAPLLAAAILVFYLVVAAWLLRREAATTCLAVVVVLAAALALRLVYPDDYPPGWNEDEVKAATRGVDALRLGPIYQRGPQGSILHSALFQSQLIPIVGANQWALRSYAALAGALTTVIGFGVARALGLRVAASLGVAALLATLAPQLFYGRVHFGGELLLHQLLMLAGVAYVGWRAGGWWAVAVGGCGLGLLLYDYAAGRSMVFLPLFAAWLVRGGSRWRMLSITALGIACWSFFLAEHPDYLTEAFARQHDPRLSQDLLSTLWAKLLIALRAFSEPVGRDAWLAVTAGAIHPPLLLALAVGGVLIGGRRGWLAAGGFFLGLVPSVLSLGYPPSSHRMMMSFVFIPLAAALALDRIPWRWPRRLAIAVAVSWVGWQSATFFFSDRFWVGSTNDTFDPERSRLVESMPPSPHERFLVSFHLRTHFQLRAVVDQNFEYIDAGNWWQPRSEPVSVWFEWLGGTGLGDFYASALGEDRVQRFGRAFSATIEPEEWHWLTQHGWLYTASCGRERHRAVVPALVHRELTFKSLHCRERWRHRWSGRWNGAETTLRLVFRGLVEASTSSSRTGVCSFERPLEFRVAPGDLVEVTLYGPQLPIISLLELSPVGSRIPPWGTLRPAVPR